MSKTKFEFRDISTGLKKFRDFLLGRKHTLHLRFPPLLSPRTIPPPDIPRGLELKYSKQYYFERNVMNSVKPPIIAPVAEGSYSSDDATKKAVCGTIKAEQIVFQYAPTPGPTWWWDGHCYYECVPDPPSQKYSQDRPCIVVPPGEPDTILPAQTCDFNESQKTPPRPSPCDQKK